MRDDKNIERARKLRQHETSFEHRLWQELRNRRALGLKFRRQHAVADYVVDFACLEAKLLIEIDGYWHQFRKADDKTRDEKLRERGFTVIRYDVEHESADAHSIAEAIAHEAKRRLSR